MSYSQLLSPYNIGKLNLKNRIILSAMGSNFSEDDGSCGQRIIDYYRSQASGGTALIIAETSSVSWPFGATTPNTVGFSNDRFIAGLTQLVDAVHEQGVLIAAQLNHGGKVAQYESREDKPIWVASVPKKLKGDLFRSLSSAEIATFVKASSKQGKPPQYKAMDSDDIAQLTDDFRQAALRAKTAGFDAIEIHAGHGYLLASFLSPFANERDDEYNGNAENRSRLLCNIIETIKLELGADYPVIVRLDAHEYRIDGGITITDAIQHAQYAVAAGADAIDVSAYGNGLSGIAFTEAPLVHQPKGLLAFAKQIKRNISVPIIGVGRITATEANTAIAAQHIDFVAMGRQLLADPHLPNKLQTNPNNIRPCIYCYVCVSKIFLNQPLTCAVNPNIGREAELNIITADNSNNIVVIGAGPAGLEISRLLAKKGHSVTLIEKSHQLGGTARIAALPYSPNGHLVQWLIDSVKLNISSKQNPINIKLNTQVNIDELIKQQPDHIIVATGAQREAPDIKGKHLPHVFDGNQLRAMLLGEPSQQKQPLFQQVMIALGRWWGITNNTNALRFFSQLWMPLGKDIVIIGGGLVGLELAEFLLERRRRVTVIEPSDHLGTELSVVRRARVLHCLREAGVKLVKSAKDISIDELYVHYSTDSLQQQSFSDVIIALGASADTSLLQQIQQSLANHTNGEKITVSAIGDCVDIGYIEGAMRSARELAARI